ncbi:MAG: hypothetical protein P8010_08610, partial [Desulfosarcinaceae bacterium]
LDWLYAHDFAIEIAPDPKHLDRLAPLVWPYIQKGLPIRFNALIPGYALGDTEPAVAHWALTQYMALVDVVSAYSQPVITCRIGTTRNRGICGRRAVANLTTLVDYAARRGVTIALANQKTGPTATPERHLQWARQSGARITLDLGHAMNAGASRRMPIADYIERATPRLVGVHLYTGISDDGATFHIEHLEPVIDQLAQSDCRWWTLACCYPKEMLAVRGMVLDCLDFLAEALYRRVAN